jgi:hypothetical protein
VLVVVVPSTAQAAPPPPNVPNAIMGGPFKADLPEMPEGTVNDRSLPEQASAMAEAQARPAMATTAGKKRGRAVARVAHAGHACYGATHNPHWSSHYPGYVAVQGQTTCWNHSVSVTTHLYKWIFGAWYFRDAASNFRLADNQGQCEVERHLRLVAGNLGPLSHVPLSGRYVESGVCSLLDDRVGE